MVSLSHYCLRACLSGWFSRVTCVFSYAKSMRKFENCHQTHAQTTTDKTVQYRQSKCCCQFDGFRLLFWNTGPPQTAASCFTSSQRYSIGRNSLYCCLYALHCSEGDITCYSSVVHVAVFKVPLLAVVLNRSPSKQ